ncbi:hypothetical protein CG478_022485 (plasmid) [Bacillus cytotoxicus]|uniref:hypothetical protein n=3 Tax=Bacillus cereus group TaxID=86661 RepID=UPI000B970B42|nr:hypothetical protein [Bacillus cytotoxicus]AWC31021.1 hypothetical protein CG483_022650 [Bacillus cytotoxicus]AWC35031.1 hypothetical protein CG482_022495 [Bacillus cytotoxicus]AWC39070.1 hypothetical protein CG481_022500 [Bacillus cytotoxicus]AWC43113.1 hypothetical protein CG480_022485 [Bacillus cytotoxicus]AWC46974.1 hypothetical protein CG479_021465 [Bacillus cytotoxicus]
MKIMLSTDSIVEKYLGMALENPKTPFTYNDTTLVNVKDLYNFINKNCKSELVDFEEVIKEVIETAMTQGGPNCSYELGSHNTKSGNTETISFEYDFEYDEEEDESTNHTITF